MTLVMEYAARVCSGVKGSEHSGNNMINIKSPGDTSGDSHSFIPPMIS